MTNVFKMYYSCSNIQSFHERGWIPETTHQHFTEKTIKNWRKTKRRQRAELTTSNQDCPNFEHWLTFTFSKTAANTAILHGGFYNSGTVWKVITRIPANRVKVKRSVPSEKQFACLFLLCRSSSPLIYSQTGTCRLSSRYTTVQLGVNIHSWKS